MNGPGQSDSLLAGKRIAVLAADGFEQAELDAAMAALQGAGAAPCVVALRAGRIRGMNVQQPANLLRVDQKIGTARAADFDGVLVPGGYIGPDLLRQSEAARDLLRAFDTLGKPIACMSHAALVLVSSGLAKGRSLTCWPGVRDDLVNAGATWLNREVVRDGRYLTSRTPEDAAAFVQALLPFLAGEASPAQADARADAHADAQADAHADAQADAQSDAQAGRYPATSDPPPPAAPELPGQSMRWLAAPSLGAMLSLAILGVGVVAANHRRRRGGSDKGDDDTSTQALAQAPAQPPVPGA